MNLSGRWSFYAFKLVMGNRGERDNIFLMAHKGGNHFKIHHRNLAKEILAAHFHAAFGSVFLLYRFFTVEWTLLSDVFGFQFLLITARHGADWTAWAQQDETKKQGKKDLPHGGYYTPRPN